MLQGEHSAILSTFNKLPFVIKTFVLSILEWPFYTGFTVLEISILITKVIIRGSGESVHLYSCQSLYCLQSQSRVEGKYKKTRCLAILHCCKQTFKERLCIYVRSNIILWNVPLYIS